MVLGSTFWMLGSWFGSATALNQEPRNWELSTQNHRTRNRRVATPGIYTNSKDALSLRLSLSLEP